MIADVGIWIRVTSGELISGHNLDAKALVSLVWHFPPKPGKVDRNGVPPKHTQQIMH